MNMSVVFKGFPDAYVYANGLLSEGNHLTAPS